MLHEEIVQLFHTSFEVLLIFFLISYSDLLNIESLFKEKFYEATMLRKDGFCFIK